MVTDVLLTGLPAHIVWKIQIPLRTKILVSTLMGLGIIATGFGIMRAVSLGTATDDLTCTFYRPRESTYARRSVLTAFS